ncbi:MAG: hypothetical protein BroJett011_56740 [Chloroflexota bacterium]|nr:MAG: hypothetical protein BroJett011_56740 [Chloroflexota bacterium]
MLAQDFINSGWLQQFWDSVGLEVQRPIRHPSKIALKKSCDYYEIKLQLEPLSG